MFCEIGFSKYESMSLLKRVEYKFKEQLEKEFS